MAYNKSIADGYFALSSTGESMPDREEEDSLAQRLKGKCLGQIFTERHANLTSVILELMDARKMILAVQKPLLEEDYWYTGKYNYADLEPVSVSRMLLTAVGKVEQAVLAGLQILYDIGPKSKSGDNGYRVQFNMNKKIRRTHVSIFYHFNGQPVNLAIEELGEHHCVMTLFIAD